MAGKERLRCEGWRRHGGAFTMGPPEWEQCKSDAITILTVEQDGKTTKEPACLHCWNEGTNLSLNIIKADPIDQA